MAQRKLTSYGLGYTRGFKDGRKGLFKVVAEFLEQNNIDKQIGEELIQAMKDSFYERQTEEG